MNAWGMQPQQGIAPGEPNPGDEIIKKLVMMALMKQGGAGLGATGNGIDPNAIFQALAASGGVA